jgi:hypothetical protein
MHCEQVKDSFPDYLAKTLSQSRSDAIESHLLICAACRRELTSVETAWSRLGVLEDVQPSPQVRARFYAMLEDHQATARSRLGRRVTFADWLEAWMPSRPIWQFALGLLLLAIGVGLGRWSLEKVNRMERSPACVMKSVNFVSCSLCHYCNNSRPASGCAA